MFRILLLCVLPTMKGYYRKRFREITIMPILVRGEEQWWTRGECGALVNARLIPPKLNKQPHTIHISMKNSSI